MTDEEKSLLSDFKRLGFKNFPKYIYNGSGECVTVESNDSTTFEGSRRELSTVRNIKI